VVHRGTRDRQGKGRVEEKLEGREGEREGGTKGLLSGVFVALAARLIYFEYINMTSCANERHQHLPHFGMSQYSQNAPSDVTKHHGRFRVPPGLRQKCRAAWTLPSANSNGRRKLSVEGNPRTSHLWHGRPWTVSARRPRYSAPLAVTKHSGSKLLPVYTETFNSATSLERSPI